MNNKKLQSRRKFIENFAAAGVIGTICAGQLLPSCKSIREQNRAPVFPERAPDGPPLKAGLIGCGSRGIGAAFNFLDAGNDLQITAIADLFQDRVNRCQRILKNQRDVDIPDENCYTGFDAYKNIIDTDVDVILEASLAYCRPLHFEAAVNARKHVFLEKPAGVDPVGIRSVLAAGKMAEAAGLSVVAGTQRRHSLDHIQTYLMVKNGAIGDLISANCYFKRGGPRYVQRQDGWCEMENMMRNRNHFCWVTGDLIVNLLIHNIDHLNWFFEKHPVKATGFGGRHHRWLGDMYDFFSVEYTFDDGRNYQAMGREIDGCSNRIGQTIFGTKGYTNCENKIWDNDGKIIWEYEYPLDEEGRPTEMLAVPPQDQEIINLVTAIRTNNPLNEAENLANSTLTGIMGRESAYTGMDVTWEEMMNSNLKLGPTEYKMGNVDIKTVVPVPGISAG